MARVRSRVLHRKFHLGMAVRNYIGLSAPRAGGVEKVTGHAAYVADVAVPGMLWGKVLRSAIPYGRIVRIDTTRAQQIPGVRAVVTGADTAGRRIGRCIYDMPILADGIVRFTGEKIAAVAAETEQIAETACDLIEVEYEELTPVFDPLAALDPAAPVLHPDLVGYSGLPKPLRETGNTVVRLRWEKGDIQEGFRDSDLIVENTFTTQVVHQGYIEPHACVVKVGSSGRIDIWACNKAPFALRRQLAAALGLPFEQLIVHPSYIGGDFGGKGDFMDVPVCYLLAQFSGRPVKLVMDYGEEFLAGNPRHAAIITVKTGVKNDGALVAQHTDYVFDSGAYAAFKPIGFLVGAEKAVGPYRIPHTLSEERIVYTNKTPCGHMRAPGYPQGYFATESHMDMVAERLGMDPVELRKRNLMHDADESPSGHVVPHIQAEEVLAAAVEVARYHTPKPPNVGRGVAIVSWLSLGGECYAFVGIDAEGTVTLSAATMDQGSGTHTVMRQLVAEELDLSPESIKIEMIDTSRVRRDQGLGGSRGTRIYGHAALGAAVAVRRQLLEIAADLLSVGTDDLVLSDGGVLATSLGRRVTFPEIVKEKGTSILGEGHYANTTSGPDASVCVQVVEVAVDEETGAANIKQVTTAHHTGTVINPLMHQGQIDGGVVMGLGYASMEELSSEMGKVMTVNFGDYKIPCVSDIPALKTVVIESHYGSGPHNSMSIGETPVIPFAAALANAVKDATGVRVNSLPITAEKIFRGSARS